LSGEKSIENNSIQPTYLFLSRQLMPGGGGIMVYVNKACEASYLEDLQSDYYESIWLKLHHPDLVATESTSEEAVTFRPLTIGILM
jgi:hypothetical protein